MERRFNIVIQLRIQQSYEVTASTRQKAEKLAWERHGKYMEGLETDSNLAFEEFKDYRHSWETFTTEEKEPESVVISTNSKSVTLVRQDDGSYEGKGGTETLDPMWFSSWMDLRNALHLFDKEAWLGYDGMIYG